MRIGIIGELDGDERLYGRLADRVGHEAQFHGGKGMLRCQVSIAYRHGDGLVAH